MKSWSRPVKKGCSAMMRSSVSMTLRLPYSLSFLSDVDSYGTPGNAPSAAYTSRSAELVDPRSQLVSHPLAIASFSGSANVAPVDVRKAQREARVPTAPALGLMTGHVGYVLYRGAKTGGTDHGAVGARQAASGDVVPAWVVEVLVQQLFDSDSIDASHLLASRTVHCSFCLMQICTGGLSGLQTS